jgi:hypothetical protein
MTLKEAITIAQNKMEIDYSGMEKQREVDELDEALDLIFKAAMKYSELPEQEKATEYYRGFEAGITVGARAERARMITYIKGKTIEERKEEIVAIPYIGETREEEPNT